MPRRLYLLSNREVAFPTIPNPSPSSHPSQPPFPTHSLLAGSLTPTSSPQLHTIPPYNLPFSLHTTAIQHPYNSICARQDAASFKHLSNLDLPQPSTSQHPNTQASRVASPSSILHPPNAHSNDKAATAIASLAYDCCSTTTALLQRHHNAPYIHSTFHIPIPT